MKLKKVFSGVKLDSNRKWEEIKNINIRDISYNSQACGKGHLFVAIEGKTTDGHKYVLDAYNKGCRIFVVKREVNLPKDAVKIFVDNSRRVLSKISSNFFKKPSRELLVIGITGTKGKTTTANMIRGILQNNNINTGIIGTNGIFYNKIKEDTVNTTPESYKLQKIFREMVDNKVKAVVMEVSSGGLMMGRVDDIEFDISIFTNISPDHIGPKEHPDFQHYLMCKSKLFSLSKHGIINIDDDYGDYIIDKAKSSIESFSINQASDLQAINIEKSKRIDALGTKFTCKASDTCEEFYLSLPGIFNIYNALSAIAVANYLEINSQVIKDSLKDIKIPGRVEVLPILDYASIIIDYAHNGVSLENVLDTLREYKPNRLICLIGSVGGRTEGRRKELGDVAARKCDICVLTADNPDYEDPMEIIREMEKSFTNSNCRLIKEPDREKAVKKAIRLLEKGDILLLAGKGHEEYQLIKGREEYYSDQEAAINAVKELLEYKEEII